MKKVIILFNFLLLSNYFLQSQSLYNGLIGACDNDYGHDVAVFEDGTRYFLTNTISFTNNGTEHILITKIDSNNNQVWSKIYLGPVTNESYKIKKYKQKLIISGTCRSSSSILQKVFVMQIDTSGQLIWCCKYNDGVAYGMDICNNGDIILTGVKYNPPDYDRLFVLKLDTLGNVKWSKEFYSTNGRFSHGQDIIQTRDNNIIVTGFIGYGSGNYSCRHTLIKLDENGNIIWKNYYNYILWWPSKINVVELSTDSNLITNGTTRYPNWNSYLLKVNSINGQLIWNKTYDFGYNDYSTGVIENNNHLYLYGNETLSNYYDMVVMKTDLYGNVNWAHSYGTANEDIVNQLVKFRDKLLIIGTSNNYFGTHISLTQSDSYCSEIDTNGYGSNLLDSLVTVNTGTFSSISVDSNFSSGTYSVSKIPVILIDSTINAILDTSICEPLSIGSYSNIDNIVIFPNPNNGIFTVKLMDHSSNITIYNSMGKVIHEQKCSKGYTVIDISYSANGLYFMKIRSINGISTKKMLKL